MTRLISSTPRHATHAPAGRAANPKRRADESTGASLAAPAEVHPGAGRTRKNCGRPTKPFPVRTREAGRCRRRGTRPRLQSLQPRPRRRAGGSLTDAAGIRGARLSAGASWPEDRHALQRGPDGRRAFCSLPSATGVSRRASRRLRCSNAPPRPAPSPEGRGAASGMHRMHNNCSLRVSHTAMVTGWPQLAHAIGFTAATSSFTSTPRRFLAPESPARFAPVEAMRT